MMGWGTGAEAVGGSGGGGVCRKVNQLDSVQWKQYMLRTEPLTN